MAFEFYPMQMDLAESARTTCMPYVCHEGFAQSVVASHEGFIIIDALLLGLPCRSQCLHCFRDSRLHVHFVIQGYQGFRIGIDVMASELKWIAVLCWCSCECVDSWCQDDVPLPKLHQEVRKVYRPDESHEEGA